MADKDGGKREGIQAPAAPEPEAGAYYQHLAERPGATWLGDDGRLHLRRADGSIMLVASAGGDGSEISADEMLAELEAMIDRAAEAEGADAAEMVERMLARARLLAGYAPEDPELLHDLGGAVDEAAAGAMLGVTADAVEQMIREGRLLTVTLRQRVLLPRLQFAAEGGSVKLLPGISEIVRAGAKAGAEGWHILGWLTSPSNGLGERLPIEVLRAGDLEAAVRAARQEV